MTLITSTMGFPCLSWSRFPLSMYQCRRGTCVWRFRRCSWTYINSSEVDSCISCIVCVALCNVCVASCVIDDVMRRRCCVIYCLCYVMHCLFCILHKLLVVGRKNNWLWTKQPTNRKTDTPFYREAHDRSINQSNLLISLTYSLVIHLDIDLEIDIVIENKIVVVLCHLMLYDVIRCHLISSDVFVNFSAFQKHIVGRDRGGWNLVLMWFDIIPETCIQK